MQNKDLAAILESKITGNTVRIGRTLADEIVKALVVVKRGKWILGGQYNKCSICKGFAPRYDADGEEVTMNYCPHCGARMDGEV